MSGILSDNTARSSGLAKAASGGAGVSWVSSIQTSNFTAEAGKGYFVNTTDGAITLTLPASPTAGDIVAIKDYAEAFDNNALTIARNSSPIQGKNSNSKITTARASLFLLYVDSTEGWVYTSQSNVADLEAAVFVAATGGTITTSGDFKIHTFTSSGTFEVTTAGNAKGSNTVDYLVVAAGGGGGANSGGGGGGGGFRTNFPQPATGGLPVSAQEYPITVGAGGVDGGNNPGDPIGTNGGNSIFSSITSAGGGYGGSPVHTFCGTRNGDGGSGGSGGGGGTGGPSSPVSNDGGAGNTPPVSPSQGNNGGAGSSGPNCGSTGGGGGGAGAVGDTGQTPGSDPSTNMGACGGAGTANSINGSSVTYAGGGGGTRQYTPGSGRNVPVGGSGGAGGGGNGGSQGAQGNVAAAAGSANTGGGGGGAHNNTAGGNGGSGVVIIRYKFQA